MLRRKLLLILGPLVVLLVATSVAAIWLLQGVLRDLNHINHEAWAVVEKVNDLSITINAVEVDLYALHIGRERHLDHLIDNVERLQTLMRELDGFYVVHHPEAQASYKSLVAGLPAFQRDVARLATAQSEQLARQYTEAALNDAVQLRHSTLPLSRYVRSHAQLEQNELVRWFRWLVLGLSIVFLLVINISVMVLLRMGGMILRPIDKLMEATRQLARERFDYRVNLEQHDEFGQLGQAYNKLAEQLQANEQRKIEMLQQVALTMNHELNNAIATIELQLQLLGRSSGGSETMEKRLRQIRESLERVTHTVESLKHVRRVVLTEYVSGMKMLDLQKSVQAEEELAIARSGG